MKRILKIVLIILAAAFIIAQFIRPDRTNPPVVEAETLEASTQVPEHVRAILDRSCNDCHTNKTTYPWYSNISPVSWFLANHIKDGRRHLNFSVWNTYEKRKKDKKLEEVCTEVKGSAMPLPSYLWIHGGAVLSPEDVTALCDWANAAREQLNAS